jgi:hypothetical protein
MNFDYYTLKKAEREGLKLGNWNGKAVFASSANHLENKGSGAYYILYDDENKIVARTNSGWKSYGEVTEQGSVNEYSSARNYKTPAEAAAAARKVKEERSSAAWPQTSGMRSAATLQSEPIPQAVMKVSYSDEGTYAPGYDRTERPVGDVKTELDVEATLQRAREMTIEGLLEGFLPGVDFSIVGQSPRKG